LMIFELRSFPARAPFAMLWTRKYLSLISLPERACHYHSTHRPSIDELRLLSLFV
jgi:hypothetical protein